MRHILSILLSGRRCFSDLILVEAVGFYSVQRCVCWLNGSLENRRVGSNVKRDRNRRDQTNSTLSHPFDHESWKTA